MIKIISFVLIVGFPLLLVAGEGELSLEQDRKELDKLRKDIPSDVKVENDDLAFILKLFDDKKRESNGIRREFDNAINRVRKKKQSDWKKIRDDYNKKEKEIRSAYVSAAAQKRKEFLASKPVKENSDRFFAEERDARKAFFSDERDKRGDFESDQKAEKKTFEEFISGKRKEFDDLMRIFRKDQEELKILERQKRKATQSLNNGSSVGRKEVSPENQKHLEEFQNIPKGPGVPLEPQDEEKAD